MLDGIPGAPQSEGSLSGETVALSVNNAWRFSAADTGNMALEAPEGGAAIPDTSLGDSGLDYRYGYTGFTVVAQNLVGAAPGSVTVRMAYSTPLPADKLLVYALTLDGGKEKYKLLPQDAWSRVDDRTLDVTFQDNGGWDIDSAQGVVRAGIAPVQNTLGGFEEKSGNGGGSAGGAVLLGLLAVLGLRRVAPSGMAYRSMAGRLPWRRRGAGEGR
ncbi:hypothetical protein SAMN04488135_101630 [Pollutimonas bauzanensis]|uniref:Uncharacterized protein n=1 Tax=Pollutimonas bauzanensis TaxID=658167 RepID=A0A1M5NVS9_9BURK|nr:hypothetical protein SAMN04488135_101630 [Pollutimonas bauzanensis]